MIIESFRICRDIFGGLETCSVKLAHCLWETNKGDEADLYFSVANKVAVVGNNSSKFIDYYNSMVELFPWLTQSEDMGILRDVSVMEIELDGGRTNTTFRYDHASLINFLAWAINMKIVIERIAVHHIDRKVMIIFRPTDAHILEYRLRR